MRPEHARILLTGATGGIGQASARELAGSGAKLLLAGRSPARLAAQARELEDLGSDCASWRDADLTDAAALSGLAQAAAEWGCNVVVHAGGASAFGPAGAQTPESLQQVLGTNLLAPMQLTTMLLPHLQAQPKAQVVFLGSALGAIGLPGFSTYCASKFGLRGYAQALRRELAGSPVRIQFMGPRSTRTPFNDAAVEAYNRATGTAMDEPGAVAQALLRLLQDEAPERFLGFPERLAVRLNGAVPTWLDGAFERHRRAAAGAATRPSDPLLPRG